MADDLLHEFLKGKHVMCHNQGMWNAIWSDMFIELTFVRYGHQAGGATCVTRWDLSLRACSQQRGDLLAMKDKQNNKTTTTHKEDAPSRITRYASDGQKSKKLFKITSIPLPPTPTHLGYLMSSQVFTR